jgi:DNA topoisomerase-3
LTDFAYIAEKPSLAEAIAKVLGKINGATPQKNNGVWTVGKDAVTWVRGHFFELWMPQDYDVRQKTWRRENYPFYPDKWKRKPRKDDRNWIPEQTRIIKTLISSAKNIVNVGDAAREGQLLIDEVLEELGFDPFAKNVWRLWIKDMTDSGLEGAIRGKFPNADKRNLFHAAVMRQKADWVHGLNLTGLYTALAKDAGANMLISVGRVQTPTLKLVVDRDRLIENFKPTKHFLPYVSFRHANGSFQANWIIPADHPGLDPEGYFIDKAACNAVIAKVQGKTGKVESYATQKKTKSPPLAYSLASLQKDCSARLGLTATETLEVAQYLYDNKLTSYPRSESQHLPTALLRDEAPAIMTALASTPGIADVARGADLKIKSKVWDDSKTKDHYGIVPTMEFSATMLQRCSPTQRAVFELIAKAFIANFYPDQAWNSLTAVIGVEGERFKATGRQMITQGWRVVYGAVEEDEEEEDPEKESEQSVPQMAKGDPVKAEGGGVADKETKPPARFTDGTLIDAMTKIDKFVPPSDIEIKKRLKETDGLGTSATRDKIIETLLKRIFLARPSDIKGKLKGGKKDKTQLISTEAGRSLIDLLPGQITSPGLTALWEGQLKKIEEGEVAPETFYEQLIRSVTKNVERAKEQPIKIAGATIEPLPGDGETCPSCGKGRMRTRMFQKGDQKGKRFLSCDAYKKDDPNSCRHAVFPESGPKKEVKPADGHGKTCPKCGKGQLMTRKSKSGTVFLGCNNWVKDNPKLSCDYVEFIEEKIQPLPGDGETCTSCEKGLMRTRKFFSGEQKGERFLSCDGYRKEDPNSCRNAIFPNGGSKKPAAKSGGTSKFPSKGSSSSSSSSGSRRTFKK